MRLQPLRRFLIAASLLLVLPLAVLPADAGEAAKLLPDSVGEARAQAAPFVGRHQFSEPIEPGLFDSVQTRWRNYVHPDGQRFAVQLHKTRSDSEAYSLLVSIRSAQAKLSLNPDGVNGVGTAAFAVPGRVVFFRGAAVVSVNNASEQGVSSPRLIEFARSFAETLDAGSGDIPVLVKHLPEWETAHHRAIYSVTLPVLRQTIQNQPALDAVSFGAGTEAVTADYGPAGRLVVVEYATPQVAAESDARVKQRVGELAAAGQSVPSVYKREGNYSIFVFGASDTAAAAQLAGQVKYEKDVRWLGDNPHAYDRHNRAWLSMSASVIVNTVKAAGLAILLCLGVGGVFGAIIFRRRRAQAALTESYSDAGGMMRLDLDDHAAKLLGHGEK